MGISIGRSVGVGGRIFGSLFFLVFFGMGLLFCGLIVRDVYLGAKTYTWPRIECVILDSRVQENGKRDNPYAFHVRYEYQWQGRAYSATKSSQREGSWSEYADAQRLVSKYPADTKAHCFVNPQNPSEAILQRPSLWIGLLIFLPLIFVGIGAIGVVAMWSKAAPKEAPPKPSPRPISSPITRQAGKKLATGVCAFFFLIGAVLFYSFSVRPLQKVFAARNWIPTPCTVISSRVQSHSSDDGTTYRVDILYRYEFDGQEHRSSRYQFMGASTSGYKGKANIVQLHPPGTQRTCYVNPRNPDEAVLERGLTPGMWIGAIPAAFMLAGVAGIIGTRRGTKSNPTSPFGAAADPEPVPVREIIGTVSPMPITSGMDEISGPRVLKPASSRLAGLIFFGIFAAIWNGVIWFVFLPGDLGTFRRGGAGLFNWFPIIFLLPFLAVGVVLIGVVIYQCLALCNPKAEITITPGTPALGGRLDLQWRLTGRTRVLQNLKIVLEAREEATYRRGTSTYTDKKTFLTLDAASVSHAALMGEGRASVTLPADTMPTFKSDNNAIVWTLSIRGEIPRWPDLNEEFVINVSPPVMTLAST